MLLFVFGSLLRWVFGWLNEILHCCLFNLFVFFFFFLLLLDYFIIIVILLLFLFIIYFSFYLFTPFLLLTFTCNYSRIKKPNYFVKTNNWIILNMNGCDCCFQMQVIVCWFLFAGDNYRSIISVFQCNENVFAFQNFYNDVLFWYFHCWKGKNSDFNKP